MADKKITITTEVKGNAAEQIDKTANATGNLRKELKQLTLELQNLEPGSDRFRELTARAGELRDQIADTNDIINATAGAPIENLGKGLAGVASIGVRGFQGITSAQVLLGSESKALQETMVKLQAVAGMADAIQSLGDMGQTITNIKASFGSFVSAAKAGLTGIKGAVAATGLGLLVIAIGTLYAYWDDIKGAVSGVSSEQEKLNALSAANLSMENEKTENLNAQDNTLRLQGLSERQILELKVKQYNSNIKAMEANIENARITLKSQIDAEKRNRDILKGILEFIQLPLLTVLRTIDEIAAFAGFDTNLAQGLLDFESSFLFDEKKVKEEGEKAIKEQEKTLTKLKNDRDGLVLEIQKMDKQQAEDRKKAAQQALADAKDNAAARLAAQRELQDAELELMDEGVEKELLRNKYKYERLIEDNKLNEKLTATEKKKINDALAEEKLQQDEVIRKEEEKKKKEREEEEKKAAEEKAKAERDAEEEKYQTRKTLRDKDIANMKDGIDKEKKIREAAYEDEKHEFDNLLLDKKITQEEYNKAITDAEQKKNDDIAAMDAEALQKMKTERTEALKGMLDNIAKVGEAGSAAMQAALGGAIEGVKGFLDILNTDFKEGIEGTMQKISAYAEAIGGILQGFLTAIDESNEERTEKRLEDLDNETKTEQAALKTRYEEGLITKEEFEQASSNMDKASKAKKLAIEKDAFEKDKKIRIASATIAGLQGAVAAFAGAMSLGFPAGPIVGGILAAAVGVLTAMNISKIKAQQFEGGGDAGGSAGAAPVGAGGSVGTGANSAPTPPSLSLFGQALGGSEGQGQQNLGMRQQTIRAVVVESDITGTQNRLQNYQQRAEVG